MLSNCESTTSQYYCRSRVFFPAPAKKCQRAGSGSDFGSTTLAISINKKKFRIFEVHKEFCLFSTHKNFKTPVQYRTYDFSKILTLKTCSNLTHRQLMKRFIYGLPVRFISLYNY